MDEQWYYSSYQTEDEGPARGSNDSEISYEVGVTKSSLQFSGASVILGEDHEEPIAKGSQNMMIKYVEGTLTNP